MARYGRTARGRRRAARRKGYAARRPARGRTQLRQAYAQLSRAAGVTVPFARAGPAPAQIAHRKLRYVYTDKVAAIGTAGTGYTWFWRLNGPYDPDVTVGGHQPMGYDQMAQFYHRYRVVGATITAQWENPIGVGYRRPVVGVSIVPTQSMPLDTSDASTCQEQPYTVYKVLGAGEAATGTQIITRKLKTFKPFFGDAYLTDDSYAATNSTVPSNEIYAATWLRPSAAADTVDEHRVSITITYDVIWFDPKSNYTPST
jgi:hypothetical protein